VRDRNALDEVVVAAKLAACPHCRRTGTLVGHGLLTGYAERGSDREVRGRRLLCSARVRRKGCGRTLSVLLATVIAGFSARAPTLSGLLDAVVGGMNRKRAWQGLQEAAGGGRGFSLRSGYRLWSRLCAAQSGMRTALCGAAPPPVTTDARPIAQMLSHLRLVVGSSGCVLAAYQLALQRGLFG
jgi:hypothetical protein